MGSAVGVSVAVGVCVAVAVDVDEAVGELVDVGVPVIVDGTVGQDEAVGLLVLVAVDDEVAEGISVRLGVAVGEGVADMCSTNANVANIGVYPQTVPCVESRSITIWPLSATQVESCNRNNATDAGSMKSPAGNSTQSCFDVVSVTVVETEKYQAVAEE